MDIILPILITTEKVMMIRKHCQKGVTGGSIDKCVHRAAWSHQKKPLCNNSYIFFQFQYRNFGYNMRSFAMILCEGLGYVYMYIRRKVNVDKKY